jgi:hypothetical protein
MTCVFWTKNPAILFDKNYIFDYFPDQSMSFEEKINAVTRLVILITLLGYFISFSLKVLFIGAITVFAIFMYIQFRKSTRKGVGALFKEGMDGLTSSGNDSQDITGNEGQGQGQKQDVTSYETLGIKGIFNATSNQIIDVDNDDLSNIINPSRTITNKSLPSFLNKEFKNIDKTNPFGNVLLTEITDDPRRNAAPPSFNPAVEQTITEQVKDAVQFMNPGIKNTNYQLFGDLEQNFELDQSNRVFFSTANTRIPNDQKSFAEFLYGDMPSSKESNADAAISREKDAYRYTLY